MEPTACVATFDINGILTVWSPCQLQHHARRKIADIFDLPEVKVRWLTPAVGGAFGGKLSFTNEPICIALAKKTGRSVKLEDTREEDFVARESGQLIMLHGKLGVKKDGTITTIQAKLVADAGAYLTHSSATTRLGMGRFLRLYRCSNTAGEAVIVYTNTPVSGGFRGYGNTEINFGLEQLIDMAAEKLGIDSIEFRLKNIKGTGESDSPPNVIIENSALSECIKAGAEKIDWQKKRAKKKIGRKRKGVAMACTAHVSGAQSGLLEHSNAFIKLNADGTASLVVSPCESGQGAIGVLAQIAAEELGLNIEDIHTVSGDTDVTMFDIGSHASRATYVIGNAAVRAAREAKGQLLERAAKALGVPPKELDIKKRRIYIKKSPDKGMTIAEVARDAIYNFEGECLNISGKCSFTPEKSPAFQAAFAEVEVDTETGVVQLLKMLIADDIGRAINPMNVEGQLEGGTAQGIGYALTEDFIVDSHTGATVTDSFSTYKIPSVLDVPEVEVILVEQPVASGPFGAKGVGEMGAICIAPAIANAIHDAVGVRVKELPITPEKILKNLRAK
jgi:xanthine dehydrogenase molybdenum-binding subunit